MTSRVVAKFLETVRGSVVSDHVRHSSAWPLPRLFSVSRAMECSERIVHEFAAVQALMRDLIRPVIAERAGWSSSARDVRASPDELVAATLRPAATPAVHASGNRRAQVRHADAEEDGPRRPRHSRSHPCQPTARMRNALTDPYDRSRFCQTEPNPATVGTGMLKAAASGKQRSGHGRVTAQKRGISRGVEARAQKARDHDD